MAITVVAMHCHGVHCRHSRRDSAQAQLSSQDRGWPEDHHIAWHQACLCAAATREQLGAPELALCFICSSLQEADRHWMPLHRVQSGFPPLDEHVDLSEHKRTYVDHQA